MNNGYPAIVSALVQANVSLNLKDVNGYTALIRGNNIFKYV